MAICFSTLYQLPKPSLHPTLRLPTASTSDFPPSCFTLSGSAGWAVGDCDCVLSVLLLLLLSAEKPRGTSVRNSSSAAKNANRRTLIDYSLIPSYPRALTRL